LYGGPKTWSLLDPLRTRRFFLAGVAAGVLVMSATGLAAARLIESPGQLAARSAAPAGAVITGVASMRELRTEVAVPGTVRAGHTVAVTAAAPYRAVVVTGLPARLGTVVRPGQVIAEIDGRPVILLRGTLPPFRDLREGDAGPDVSQLQAALRSLGYADYDEAGYFGPSTGFALRLLYLHLGYPAPLDRRPASRRDRHPSPQVYLPMAQVSYVPAASALVVAVNARAGSTVAAGRVVLRLATGHPYVTGLLSAGQAMLVRAGDPAVIGSASPHVAAAGTVTAIGAGVAGYPVRVTVTHPLAESLAGLRVRLTIWSAITRSPVLTVPLAAVSSTGRAARMVSFVTTIAPGGRTRRVTVTTGRSAGGYVAVTPAGQGALMPGDRVVIGARQ
jgi:hypothetical protein